MTARRSQQTHVNCVHSRALRRLQTKVGIFEDDAFFRRDAHALGAQQEGIGRGFMVDHMIGRHHRGEVMTQPQVRQQRFGDGARCRFPPTSGDGRAMP